MDVKGTAVKSLLDFVKQKYSDYYENWISSLSDESKEILSDAIMVSKWYNLKTSLLDPINILSQLSKTELKEILWEMGVYSSEQALSGIYKVFIKISSTNFIISRAPNMLETYYRNTQINILERDKNSVSIEFLKFPKDVNMIMYRIAGWVQNTFKAVGCKNVTVEVKNIEDSNEFKTHMFVSWQNL